MKSKRTFVGIGFGPIQAGLFLYEARRSGNFDRFVVSEINPDSIAKVRDAGGRFTVNIATRTGIEPCTVSNVEIFDPRTESDKLIAAISEATEVATALPNVTTYPAVAPLLARGLRGPCVVYAAENHNQAAALLARACERSGFVPDRSVQFLDTVIGKMSGVDSAGFLVEEFNRILISEVRVPEFRRGIDVFIEKPDLAPFEDAKLYGHLAVHATLGYLAHRKGLHFISEADPKLVSFARGAFLEECGPALRARWRGADELFTEDGWRAYTEDLLARMTNPFLRDRVDRVIRDARRKLDWNDRLVGAMRAAMMMGIKPRRLALGAAAAMETIGADVELWPQATPDFIRLIREAQAILNQQRST
jgi:mannitol-1-phosphate 5-dehydrogenase